MYVSQCIHNSISLSRFIHRILIISLPDMVPGLCTQAHIVDQRQDKNPYNVTILELKGVIVDWIQDQNP